MVPVPLELWLKYIFMQKHLLVIFSTPKGSDRKDYHYPKPFTAPSLKCSGTLFTDNKMRHQLIKLIFLAPTNPPLEKHCMAVSKQFHYDYINKPLIFTYG
jgi:hypothetical protein